MAVFFVSRSGHRRAVRVLRKRQCCAMLHPPLEEVCSTMMVISSGTDTLSASAFCTRQPSAWTSACKQAQSCLELKQELGQRLECNAPNLLSPTHVVRPISAATTAVAPTLSSSLKYSNKPCRNLGRCGTRSTPGTLLSVSSQETKNCRRQGGGQHLHKCRGRPLDGHTRRTDGSIVRMRSLARSMKPSMSTRPCSVTMS